MVWADAAEAGKKAERSGTRRPDVHVDLDGRVVHARDDGYTKTSPATSARNYLIESVLLTNATIVLSGDHDGTLMVPCPP